MRLDLEEGENPEVQMAPLIDCVFLLIIFFLVSTTMKKHEKELDLRLPESAAAIERPRPGDLFVIGIDRAGHYYIGSQPVGLQMLHDKLKEVAHENKHRRVRIAGDLATPFQHIVHVLDLCQFEGLQNVGIHTRDERDKRK